MAVISARYFRLYCTNAAASYYRIGEIEVRATAGGATLCTGGTAFGDSNYYPAARAFDGTASGESNVWVGNPGASRTIGYDFGSAVTMAELVVANGIGMGGGAGQHGFDFEFQYSDDGGVWSPGIFVPGSARAATDGASHTYSLAVYAVSGVVTDASGAPAARKVVALRESNNTVSSSVTSSAVTGAYSIQTPTNSAHTVVAYPGVGEGLPALVLSGVVPE